MAVERFVLESRLDRLQRFNTTQEQEKDFEKKTAIFVGTRRRRLKHNKLKTLTMYGAAYCSITDMYIVFVVLMYAYLLFIQIYTYIYYNMRISHRAALSYYLTKRI